MPDTARAIQPELPFDDPDFQTFFEGLAEVGIVVNGLRMTRAAEGGFHLIRESEIAVPGWSRVRSL